MITYKKGNLLETPDKWIAHGVNCRGVMNAGVAKAIRGKWPKVFDDYNKYWMEHSDDSLYAPLGEIVLTLVDDKVIASCFTQDSYGWKEKHVKYDAVDACMEKLSILLNGESLSIPRIGAGLAGGNWKVIEAIIEYRLKTTNVTVWEL